MILNNLKERRDMALNRAYALTKEVMTPAAEVEFEQLMGQAEELGRQIEREARNAQRVERSSARPPRSQPGADYRSNNSDRQKQAFREWMRTGQVTAENRAHLQSGETRDMGVSTPSGSITGGSVLVPQGFDPQLHSAMLSAGELVSKVRILNTDSGQPIRVTLDDDLSNTLTLLSEGTAASETDPSVSGFTSSVDELTTGLVSVSNQLLNDSAFSVDDFIAQKFGVRYYRGLAKMIAQGNGSNVQKLNPAATYTGLTGESNVTSYDSLVNTYALLDSTYIENASWVMTSSTRAALMRLKDNYGRPLLQEDATGKPFNSIFGRPICISPYSDQLGAGNVPILFGDLSSYTLRVVGGLHIGRSTERFFEKNETAYVGFARVGGYSTAQASSPAIVGYKNSAS